MRSEEEKAKEWMETQERTPRPGASLSRPYIPKGVALNPIVKMVPPESLKPNPRNDFDPLSPEEYENLKEDIAINGILDALTAKKGGTIVTGENRYRIALELKEHENEEVRRRVQNIPVRFYMNDLTEEEEYDILEGDNLFRRHLTPEQKKERLKKRILRKYKDELVLDNRGGDRKSEIPKDEVDLFSETKGSGDEDEALAEDPNQGSNLQGEVLILEKKNIAKKISENENIPLGTATRYVSEIRKELHSKDPKPAKQKTTKETHSNKDKVKEFQKKFSRLTATGKKTEVNRLVGKLIGVRKKISELNAQISALQSQESEAIEKLVSVGEKKRVQGLHV
ncbi:chromosome partitioning protein ParB [Leptospira fletcheri]|uniref:Chromosome partitioning protein ParB n=1 Tax=Leptospira fletcheri TaxID=2484981 RepID=A0A4R9G588_9LEPT|nr:ParB N-terminal domain-containing protein [Leptospira fletcheri]TGK06315.1 chromosome partitioning protein ParB [Leptospira fletcheri]